MTTLTLACALCGCARELEVPGFQPSPCPDCGVVRVLTGGILQGSIYWYPSLNCRCPACARVFDPRPLKGPWARSVDCPECGLELWRKSMRSEDWERIGDD